MLALTAQRQGNKSACLYGTDEKALRWHQISPVGLAQQFVRSFV